MNFIQPIQWFFTDLQTEEDKYKRVKYVLTKVARQDLFHEGQTTGVSGASRASGASGVSGASGASGASGPSGPNNQMERTASYRYRERIIANFPQMNVPRWYIYTRNSSIPRQNDVPHWTYNIPPEEQRPRRFATYIRNTYINDVSLLDIIFAGITGETDEERRLRRRSESSVYDLEDEVLSDSSDYVRDGVIHQDFDDVMKTFIRDAHHANRHILKEVCEAIQKVYKDVERRFTEEQRRQLNEIEYRMTMARILRTDYGFNHTVTEEYFYEIRSSTINAVQKKADVRMCIPDINHVWIFELKRHKGRCHEVIPKYKHKNQLYQYCMMESMIQHADDNVRMKIHGILVYFCNNGVSYWYMCDHHYRMKNVQSIERNDFDLA